MSPFSGSGCELKAVTQAFAAIDNLAQKEGDRNYLNELFKLEDKSKLQSAEDAAFLKGFIREVFESMVMVDYPYPSSFLSPLPGWPVKKACEFLKKPVENDKIAAQSLYNVVNLYYNYTGTTSSFCANPDKCSGAYAALGDPLGWPWQSCTEMVMPLCSSGSPNDFFWQQCPFSAKQAAKDCVKTFGSIGFTPGMMQPKWATLNYGAKDFPGASNIVFSNGYLDPWSGGGWSLETRQVGSVYGVILEQGAHHYDLRGTHPNDTEEVKRVREFERTAITMWVKEHEDSKRRGKTRMEKEGEVKRRKSRQ